MQPPRTTLPNARAMRLIHLALTLGLTLAGVVFFIVRRVQQMPVLVQSAAVAIALTVAAISALLVAVTVVRPRVPEQTQDLYWGDATVRMTVMVLWAAVEGGGLLGAVGYILTGATAPAIALALGIVTLATLGPGRFEQGDA
jgi:hypothetical protein